VTVDPFLPTLETDELVIRPLTIDDFEACHRLFVDIGWADITAGEAEVRERRRTWLEWTIAGYREFARLHQPIYGERAIAWKDDGSFVGLIGMVPSMMPFAQLPSGGAGPGARANPEVGLFWAMSPSAQGRGLVTEAARAFSLHLFDVNSLARLVATTEHDNTKSIAVMRRLGMRIEANPYPDPFYMQVVGILDAPP